MNFTNFILEFLNLYQEIHRDMIRNLYGRGPYEYFRESKKQIKQIKKIKEASLRTILWRLKKRGFVKNENNKWFITRQGKKYLERILKFKNKKQIIDKDKRIIIIFDIPEQDRGKRNLLRIKLVSAGFKMLQKSVWIGPSPINEEFIKSLKGINILKYLKFFKVFNKELI